MYKILILILSFFLIVSITEGALENIDENARTLGTSGATSAVIDEASLFANPGGMGFMKVGKVSGFWTRLFGMKELEFFNTSIIQPTRAGTFGFGMSSFGGELYKEQKIIIGYGRRMHERLGVGGNIKGMRVSILGYGNEEVFGIDTGIIVYPYSRIFLGFAASNINSPKLGVGKEDIPQKLTAGIMIIVNPDVKIKGDLVKDPRFGTEVRLGTEIKFLERFTLRSGGRTNPKIYSLGMGIDARVLEFDYSFSIHPVLGMTHGAGISMTLRR